MVSPMVVAGRGIGPGFPCFIIAEAGVNHNGELDLAFKLVDAAAEAGVDAVKFQTFRPESLVTRQARKAEYQEQQNSEGKTQFEMLKLLELSGEAFEKIYQYCSERNILFLSTPFDYESVDLLDRLGVAAFKIGSGEVTNLPFLRAIAARQKPVILSTGMSTLSEAEDAVMAIEGEGNKQIAVLHCTSNYPTDPKNVNLRAMKTLGTAFQYPVGYSDHTQGTDIPVAAVALGACIIEKHMTLDRNMPGPDHKASMEPLEMKAMVESIRKVEAALGSGRKTPTSTELDVIQVARRSLVAARDIPAGTELVPELIVIKRPGTGLPPSLLPYVLGRTTRVDVAADSCITFEMLQ